MTIVPASTFARRLRRLDHRAFVEFVAAVWEASGSEVTVDGPTLVVENDGIELRILVLAPGRRRRLWPAPEYEGEIDRVITPRPSGARRAVPPGTPDAPIVDAADLRRRILYGVAPQAGDQLCQEALGIPLRDGRWRSGTDRPSRRRGGVAVAGLVLAVLLGAVLWWIAPTFLGIGDDRDAIVDDGDPNHAAVGGESASDAWSSVRRGTDVATGTTVYVGSFDESLYALDAETGQQRWRFTGPHGAIFSSPTVVDGTLYVGSMDGNLYAVDATTGEREWAFGGTSGSIFASPTVVGDTVYVTSMDRRVYAVDAETGEPIWKSEDLAGAFVASPTVADGRVYVANDPGTVYALNATSGEEEWALTADGGIGSSPTATEGSVYVGTDEGTVYAIDAETGQHRWRFREADDAVVSSPAVLDDGTDGENRSIESGTVYVGSIDGTVYAIDADSGDEIWAFTEPEDAVFASPTVADTVGGEASNESADRTVYVGAGDDTVYAIDAETGEREWTFSEAVGGFSSSPTVAGDVVYLGANNGTAYALHRENGSVKWQFTDSERVIQSSPTVVDDPIDGDSVGSRVRLGTLGHHHDRGTGPAKGDPQESTDAHLRIADVAPSTELGADGRTRLEVTIVNSGENAGTTTADVSIDGERIERTELHLEPSEGATVEVSFVAPEDPYEYEYVVVLDDEEVAGTATAVGPPSFEIDEVDAPAEAEPGDSVSVQVTVRNTGGSEGSTHVELLEDGPTIDATEIELDGGESRTTTLTVELSAAEETPFGDRSYRIVVDGDTHEVSVAVSPSVPLGDEVPGFGIVAGLLGLGLAAWRLRRYG